jgi:hypothetical protein
MNPTKANEVLDLTKRGLSTFYYIGQMARYIYQYTLAKDLQNDGLVQVNEYELAQNRDKMIKYTCLAGIGALGLFAFGIAGLISQE